MTHDDLERAAQAYDAAAERFRAGEVPSGTAHAWAAHGHVVTAGQRLDDQARQHTQHALLPDD